MAPYYYICFFDITAVNEAKSSGGHACPQYERSADGERGCWALFAAEAFLLNDVKQEENDDYWDWNPNEPQQDSRHVTYPFL
jgi:hypothetical protein